MKKSNLGSLKVKEVKNICLTYCDCVKCPLFRESNGCPFEHYFPAKWEVN